MLLLPPARGGRAKLSFDSPPAGAREAFFFAFGRLNDPYGRKALLEKKEKGEGSLSSSEREPQKNLLSVPLRSVFRSQLNTPLPLPQNKDFSDLEVNANQKFFYSLAHSLPFGAIFFACMLSLRDFYSL